MPVLYASSSNPGKLLEFTFAAQHASGEQFEIQALPGLAGLKPPVEDGATYQENAALKAVYYSGFSGGLVFADDSGLEVAALNGEPGIHSARFAGFGASGAENNALLLSKMAGKANRRARFVTAISLAKSGKVLQTTEGVADGEILSEARGSLGFGYDALFLFPPLAKTFAELGDVEKFGVSARGEAFRRLLTWLGSAGCAEGSI